MTSARVACTSHRGASYPIDATQDHQKQSDSALGPLVQQELRNTTHAIRSVLWLCCHASAVRVHIQVAKQHGCLSAMWTSGLRVDRSIPRQSFDILQLACNNYRMRSVGISGRSLLSVRTERHPEYSWLGCTQPILPVSTFEYRKKAMSCFSVLNPRCM